MLGLRIVSPAVTAFRGPGLPGRLQSRAWRWPARPLAAASSRGKFVPAVDFEGDAQFGCSARIRQGASGELLEPAHPVPDRVGMAEQYAGRLAGGAAVVEPGTEGSEQDRPLAGRYLAQRGQDAAGDVPHHFRVAARGDREQV